jgi:hypothetical protein
MLSPATRSKSELIEIDKTLEGFDFHVNEDHNMWNYLYFMYYLKKKQTDLTGIEAEISKKIRHDNISWFPLGKALKLTGADETESLEKRVSAICSSIDKIIEDHNELVLLEQQISTK